LLKDFIESSLEGVDLLLALDEEEVLDVEVDELLAILFCH